jgi:glycosyltransferase 2 family protein
MTAGLRPWWASPEECFLRDRVITLFKISASLALIVWAFSRVDLAQVGIQLASANLLYFLAALALYEIAITINAAKWQILLRAQGVRIPWMAALEFQFIGFFFNNFLPMVGGDVMRGYGLARYTDRTADAAVSVLVDRIVGLMAYMATAVVAAFIVVTLTGRSDLQAVEWVAAVALVVLAVGFSVLLSRRLRALISRIFAIAWLARLAPLWTQVSGALDAYRFRYQALVLAFGTGLLGILATTFVNWSLSRAMGGLMPLEAIFLFNPLIALLGMVPIFIAGLGLNQTAYPFFFGLAGVPHDHALAVSLLMQVIIILGSLPGGLFWLRGRHAAEAPAAAGGGSDLGRVL